MKLLCTMPGKYGDILWSLLTCRALAEITGDPIDLTVSGKYGDDSFCRLLQDQPYIATVSADPAWIIEERGLAPMNWEPPQVPPGYDTVIHLGYRGWPARGLPFFIQEQVLRGYPALELGGINPTVHWIEIPGTQRQDWWTNRKAARIAVGFSDDWFELKYGVYHLLDMHSVGWQVLSVANSPRWNEEGGAGSFNWREASEVIQQADLLVACNSALHVLGVALGTPVVILEPSEARHNPIFWPLGQEGPQVWGVRGGDGKLTFDARALCQKVEQVLIEEIGTVS